MSECVFCAIAHGVARAEIVCADEEVIALMDICPIRSGHAMIIPREHFAYFEDLPEATAGRIVHLGQRLSRAMKALYGVERVAFLFTGGDHAHAHAHVVPMHEKTDITSRRYIAEEILTFRSTPRVSAEELAATAAELRQALGRSGT
jgi:histidine triad (HIT) family protein